MNSGEGEVARLIQRERESLRPDQFFDVDMVPFIIIIMIIIIIIIIIIFIIIIIMVPFIIIIMMGWNEYNV